MTVTPAYRRPMGIVTANAAVLSRVLGATCTRGWDQMISQASITVPYPPPAQLGIGAKVAIRGGIATAPLRFTGYVTGHGSELWPSAWTFPCQDVLWLAVHYHPTTTHDLSNKTDQAAWIYILTVMGLAFNPSLILGTGKKIGSAASAALTWGPETSAFEMLRRIDEVSIVDHGGGHLTQFRGWVDFGGQIRRTGIANLPGLTAARSFVEGVDLESGSASVDHRQNPNTSFRADGDRVSSTVNDGGSNPWATIPNAGFFLYPMLQQSSGDDLTTAAVAMFMLQKLGRNLVTIGFKTWRDDLIGAIETVLFDSDHHRLTLNAFVQSVVFGWYPDGEMSQQVTLTSVRDLNTNTAGTGPPTQFNSFDGAPIPPGAAVLIPVIPDSVIAAFEVLYIDVELVLIADVETLLYTAVCRDTSTASGGTIASRAWTTAGGATPSTGSDVSFNPSWTDLATASVTLTVTGSVGGTDAVTIAISLSMGVPVRTRDLFAAGTDRIEAFSGAERVWRTYTTGIVAATVVANGPLWGDGETVYRSSNYLATPPLSSVPLAGANVLCIWTELDRDASAVAVGLSDGHIALSPDAGATWDWKLGPDMPEPVVKIILNRTPGQIHAITATGFWQSPDSGETWGLVRAGDYRDLDENELRSWALEVTGGVGGMIEAANGSAITGSGADDLVAVTSHIFQDRGYALAADGSAYLLDTDGATALTAGAPVPEGTPQTRGFYRDGSAPDILYMALGTSIYKTTDGLRSTYWKLR